MLLPRGTSSDQKTATSSSQVSGPPRTWSCMVSLRFLDYMKYLGSRFTTQRHHLIGAALPFVQSANRRPCGCQSPRSRLHARITAMFAFGVGTHWLSYEPCANSCCWNLSRTAESNAWLASLIPYQERLANEHTPFTIFRGPQRRSASATRHSAVPDSHPGCA